MIIGTPPSIPVIKIGLGTQMVSMKTTAIFAVQAEGTNLRYAWTRNGVVIPGENRAQLRLVNVKPSFQGEYAVTVSNANGSATSRGYLYVARGNG